MIAEIHSLRGEALRSLFMVLVVVDSETSNRAQMDLDKKQQAQVLVRKRLCCVVEWACSKLVDVQRKNCKLLREHRPLLTSLNSFSGRVDTALDNVCSRALWCTSKLMGWP